jgi:ribosome-binding protein aMBF1 (putative translation factor)
MMVLVPECKHCGNEADALVKVRVEGKVKKLCEDCADRLREEGEVAAESEAVVQQMMGFKGRR